MFCAGEAKLDSRMSYVHLALIRSLTLPQERERANQTTLREVSKEWEKGDDEKKENKSNDYVII